MKGYGVLVTGAAVLVIVIGCLVALTLGGVIGTDCVYSSELGYRCGR